MAKCLVAGTSDVSKSPSPKLLIIKKEKKQQQQNEKIQEQL
jgi:hypothetical protein